MRIPRHDHYVHVAAFLEHNGVRPDQLRRMVEATFEQADRIVVDPLDTIDVENSLIRVAIRLLRAEWRRDEPDHWREDPTDVIDTRRTAEASDRLAERAPSPMHVRRVHHFFEAANPTRTFGKLGSGGE